MADKKMEQFNTLNLTVVSIVALVSLVAIVSLVIKAPSARAGVQSIGTQSDSLVGSARSRFIGPAEQLSPADACLKCVKTCRTNAYLRQTDCLAACSDKCSDQNAKLPPDPVNLS